jgi:hypothetical protein
MLSKERKAALLAWVTARKYIWLTDEALPDMPVVMHQQSGRAKTVFVYSNLIHDPALLLPKPLGGLPNWKLANSDTVLTAKTRIRLQKIKTSDLAKFKNAFLAKRVLFAPGMWAFAVLADEDIIGFMEFTRSKFGGNDMYIQCDMPVPGTKYKRLSKLIAMLLITKDTKAILEKLNLGRISGVYTTAFTLNNNPISMKYRGVLEVAKRGKTPQGEAFVNYAAPFSPMSLKGTYNTWLQKNLL